MVHRTNGMRPIDVTPRILLNVYTYPKIVSKLKLRIDDIVRISKYKGLFENG